MYVRRVVASFLLAAALPTTSFAQVSAQRGQSDGSRPPVAIILEPGSVAPLGLRPPIGYPHIPVTVILPPPRPFLQPVPLPPPRPMRPISLRARIVTGMAAGLVLGGVFGLPAASASCDVGPRATGPCRAGSAGLGLVLGGAVGAFSWLRGQ